MSDDLAEARSKAMREGRWALLDPDADPQEIADAVNALADWLDDDEPAASGS